MILTKKNFREINRIRLENNLDIAIKEVKYGELSTFSYIHGGLDFTLRELRLARGLTLDEEDNVVLVGFEKFFCDRQLDNRDWLKDSFKEEFSRLQEKKLYKSIEKLDGTMIILGLYKGEFLTSTTSSINNPFSNRALEYFNKLENKEEIKEYLKKRNSCLVFEYISKFNRIAVKYDTLEDYVLLGEISKDTLERMETEKDFHFKRPKIEYFTREELEVLQREGKDIEGFVIENDFGRLIKIKTDWWYQEHFKGTFFFHKQITKKDIVTIIDAKFKDELDEFYSLQNRDEILKLENKVGRIDDIIEDILREGRKLASKFLNTKELYLYTNKDNKFLAIAAILLSEKKEKVEEHLKRQLEKMIIKEHYYFLNDLL